MSGRIRHGWASRRQVAFLCALTLLVPLALVLPVHAGQGDSRLTRLEGRIDVLKVDVAALEEALAANTQTPARAAKAIGSSSALSRRDRILQLEEAFVRLETRVDILEDLVAANGSAVR